MQISTLLSTSNKDKTSRICWHQNSTSFYGGDTSNLLNLHVIFEALLCKINISVKECP